jgi:hypothetical protein
MFAATYGCGIAVLNINIVNRLARQTMSDTTIPSLSSAAATDAQTFYYDTEGRKLGSDPGLLPISLRMGMPITIHPYLQQFEVVAWNYHKGLPEEEAGLRIVVREVGNLEPYQSYRQPGT